MSGILLSYPRSGNHLVRYMIEFMTGIPTSGCYGNMKDKPIYSNVFPDNKTPLSHVQHDYHFIFTKFHKIPSPHNSIFLKADPPLLLILRDYKECILSHLYKNTGKNTIIPGSFNRELDMYLKILNYYNSYKGKKMIIYYEDLINDTDNVLLKLKMFIPEIKLKYFLDFLKNKDYHYYLSSNGKNRSWGGINSNGDTDYYFKNQSHDEKQKIIMCIRQLKNKHMKLFRKYLYRYSENDNCTDLDK